jgi:hypothetical protein
MKTPKTSSKPVSSKTAVKLTAKETKRKLSKSERSAIARLAAQKAHLHKTFQTDRTPAERKLQQTRYTSALKNKDFVYADNLTDSAVRAAARAAEAKSAKKQTKKAA